MGGGAGGIAPTGKGLKNKGGPLHSVSGHSRGFAALSGAAGRQQGLCCFTALRVDGRW